MQPLLTEIVDIWDTSCIMISVLFFSNWVRSPNGIQQGSCMSGTHLEAAEHRFSVVPFVVVSKLGPSQKRETEG